MARSKSKNKKSYSLQKLSAIPKRIARPVGLPQLNRLPSVILQTYEDRRTFHPEPYTRVAFALPRSAAQLVAGPNRNVNNDKTHSGYKGTTAPTGFSSGVPSRVAFKVPNRVALCVRRSRRKEVLFALRRTGKGSHSSKRFNKYSSIGC